jgi:hypothetical protein
MPRHRSGNRHQCRPRRDRVHSPVPIARLESRARRTQVLGPRHHPASLDRGPIGDRRSPQARPLRSGHAASVAQHHVAVGLPVRHQPCPPSGWLSSTHEPVEESRTRMWSRTPVSRARRGDRTRGSRSRRRAPAARAGTRPGRLTPDARASPRRGASARSSRRHLSVANRAQPAPDPAADLRPDRVAVPVDAVPGRAPHPWARVPPSHIPRRCSSGDLLRLTDAAHAGGV